MLSWPPPPSLDVELSLASSSSPSAFSWVLGTLRGGGRAVCGAGVGKHQLLNWSTACFREHAARQDTAQPCSEHPLLAGGQTSCAPNAGSCKKPKNNPAFPVKSHSSPSSLFPVPQDVFSFRCLPTPATCSGTSAPSTSGRGPTPAQTAAKPLPPRLASNSTSTFTALSNLSYVSCHGHHRALAFPIIARILRGPPVLAVPL